MINAADKAAELQAENWEALIRSQNHRDIIKYVLQQQRFDAFVQIVNVLEKVSTGLITITQGIPSLEPTVVTQATIAKVGRVERQMQKLALYQKSVNAVNMVINRWPTATKGSKGASLRHFNSACARAGVRLPPHLLQWLTASAGTA
jgi:hypothetical protein